MTTAPVPTFRSLITSFVGGGPICTGTAGAPFGSGPFVATHGLPATDFSGAAVVVDAGVVVDVEDVGAVVVEAASFENSPGPRRTITITTMIATTTEPATMLFRRCRR